MAAVEFVGHSTTLIDLDGVRLLTDPLLRRRVAHLRRAVPLRRETVSDLDAVLVSHAHDDHLDVPSLRLLDHETRIVAPKGVARLLRGFRVEEIEDGEEIEIGPVTIRATHADHDGGRPLRSGTTALGYAVLGSSRIYFAGDTDLFPELDGLVDRLDLALVPIWGWGASLGRGRHLDPEGAAEAVRLLRPRIAVPIHWGTYRPAHRSASASFLSAPAVEFARAAAIAAPEVEIRVLQPGETLTLS